MKSLFRQFCPLIATGLMVSCAVPQAETVEEQEKPDAVESSEETTNLASFGGPINDGLRFPPGMMSMPGDDELRSIRPPNTVAQPSGIIVRPPGE